MRCLYVVVLALLFVSGLAGNPYGDMPDDGDQITSVPEIQDSAGDPDDMGDVPQEMPPQDEEHPNDDEDDASFLDQQAPAAPAAPAPAANNVVVVNPQQAAAPLPPAQQYATNKDKLELALDAVKEDIIKKSKQIESESKWVKDVEEIVRTYGSKMDRVKENINNMRIAVKGLYKKKKQLENLKLQKALEKKLGEAHDDMQTLQSALAHVKTKTDEFTRTRGEVQKTISDIKRHLDRLRGKKGTGDKADAKAAEKAEEKAEKKE
jgi:prefoldin subunit 5